MKRANNNLPVENTAAAEELGTEQEEGDGGGSRRAWMQD